jgi:hypothetical protein
MSVAGPAGAAIEAARRLLDALAAPVVIEDRPVSETASIGFTRLRQALLEAVDARAAA